MTIEEAAGGRLRPNVLRDQPAPNTLGGLSQDPGHPRRSWRPLSAIAMVSVLVLALALASILIRAV
jgi:hypothetical protein